MIRPRRGIIEQRRADLERIDAMSVKVTTLTGRVQLIGQGELSIDIPFQYLFSEKPVVTCGIELEENHSPLTGFFPQHHIGVAGWDRVGEVDGAFDGYYRGMTLEVWIAGQEGQVLWVHWIAIGKALSNPVSNIGALNDF